MTTFLTSLDETTAKGLIIQMTLTCKTLRNEITEARTEKSRAARLAKFQSLNAKRVALIQEHGLQVWASELKL